MDPLAQTLTAAGNSSLLLELADALAQASAALRLRDARPATLAAAAARAAAEAQAAQDDEEAAFEAATRLAAQTCASRRALQGLRELAAQLDAGSAALQAEAGAHGHAAAASLAKTRKYEEQQRDIMARLQAVGFGPEVAQARLQARGREHGRVLAELQKAEAELQRFQGLPADLAAARAATLERLQELERLRARLQENLSAM